MKTLIIAAALALTSTALMAQTNEQIIEKLKQLDNDTPNGTWAIENIPPAITSYGFYGDLSNTKTTNDFTIVSPNVCWMAEIIEGDYEVKIDWDCIDNVAKKYPDEHSELSAFAFILKSLHDGTAKEMWK